VKKIKFIILTFVLAFSFSIQSNSKTVPASFADLAERLMPSVVNISTTQTVTTTTNPFHSSFLQAHHLKICLKNLELLKKGSLQHLDLVS
jgi:S1-C subfamily serine protease